MGTRRDLVDHRPGEGDHTLVLQIDEEGGGHQSVVHPALGIGHHTGLHLVTVVRAVVHRLDRQRQLSGIITLQQQGTDLTHREHRTQTAREVGLVVGVALLGDGERDHLETRVPEDLHEPLPVGELGIGLQGLGDTGDDLLLDRTVRAEVHTE